MVKLFVVLLFVGATLCVEIKTPINQTVPCVSTENDLWELQKYPDDCRLFIFCMNNIGIVGECPDELYFNPDDQKCDLRENVECEDSSETTTAENEEDTEITTEPTDQTTNEETTIDVTISDEPTNDDTTIEETTITTTEDENTTDDDTTTDDGSEENCEPLCAEFPPWGGQIADPNDCQRFVSCVNRCQGAIMFCPRGLHFNQLKMVCDIPQRAECLQEVCSDREDGLHASANSCRMFYACVQNNALLWSCGDTQVFDPVRLECVQEDETNTCETPEIPLAPIEVVNECTDVVESQNLRHPYLCDVYYWCVKRYLFPRQCQSELYFDADAQACNLSKLVDCTIN
ncbi:uncharacterized protein LOC131434866 [Malaya genurostris]|uniref:uncharacterized protein LOC131434866 n=1 Tax=Malaya genurostris TaxID=325434 RepID=UPI0026F3F96B|nr:uncharacterized protein LOC131434866 [Malaya genurostris]